MKYEIRVTGTPVPQPRSNTRVLLPAFAVAGAIWRKSGGSLKAFMGFLRRQTSAQVYVPEKHAVNVWKMLVKNSIRGIRPFPVKREGQLYRVDLIFLFPRPKRLIWKTRPMPRQWLGTKRNDNDNLEKAVWDAITNTGFWEDDGLVVWNSTQKYYAAGHEKPGCLISIETIDLDTVPATGQQSLFTEPEDHF